MLFEKNLLISSNAVASGGSITELKIDWSITKLNEIKHNRLNVGRIALERLVGALINCSLFHSGEEGGGA